MPLTSRDPPQPFRHQPRESLERVNSLASRALRPMPAVIRAFKALSRIWATSLANPLVDDDMAGGWAYGRADGMVCY
jgi:hypothetical protein